MEEWENRFLKVARVELTESFGDELQKRNGSMDIFFEKGHQIFLKIEHLN